MAAASASVRSSTGAPSALIITCEPCTFCVCSQMSPRRAVLVVSSSFWAFERPARISYPPLDT